MATKRKGTPVEKEKASTTATKKNTRTKTPSTITPTVSDKYQQPNTTMPVRKKGADLTKVRIHTQSERGITTHSEVHGREMSSSKRNLMDEGTVKRVHTCSSQLTDSDSECLDESDENKGNQRQMAVQKRSKHHDQYLETQRMQSYRQRRDAERNDTQHDVNHHNDEDDDNDIETEEVGNHLRNNNDKTLFDDDDIQVEGSAKNNYDATLQQQKTNRKYKVSKVANKLAIDKNKEMSLSMYDATQAQLDKDVQKKNTQVMKSYVKSTLFRLVKFITSDEEMSHDFRQFAGKVLDYMQVTGTSLRKEWWNKYKRDAKKALQERRAAINGAIKDTVKELHRTGNMPKLEDILKMRENVNNAYTAFCDHILPSVVGRNVWKEKCIETTVSQWATTTDEAFAILLLENSYLVWEESSRNSQTTHVSDQQEGKQDAAKTMYTQNGAGSKKYQGWNEEGLRRFNEIATMVRNDRQVDKKGFEEQYMQEKIGINNLKGRKGKLISQQQNDNGGFRVFMDTDNEEEDCGETGSV